ncbi:MAG: PEP-CTERM sorting domain-containing protein [Cyanobacterium sp. T60_A2020_053]|nr:PEP-CTERM sorting domain-containing protein [Cyanobacterium sp. T60_A2020_053]
MVVSNLTFIADDPSFPFLISASESGYGKYSGTFTSAPSGGFGTNTNFVEADSASGDAFGVQYGSSGEFFFLPIGYTSGGTISGSATYDNITLFDLGFDASQTYDWVFANNDFIRLQFSSSNPVTTPEPSTILGSVLVLGLGAVMGKIKKK